MMELKTLNELNYEVEQLEKQIKEAKKQNTSKLIKDTAKTLFDESSKEALTIRDIEMYLKDFYYNIRDLENIR